MVRQLTQRQLSQRPELTQKQLSQKQEINTEKLFMRQLSRLSGPLEGVSTSVRTPLELPEPYRQMKTDRDTRKTSRLILPPTRIKGSKDKTSLFLKHSNGIFSAPKKNRVFIVDSEPTRPQPLVSVKDIYVSPEIGLSVSTAKINYNPIIANRITNKHIENKVESYNGDGPTTPPPY